jgi:hypothetical protein
MENQGQIIPTGENSLFVYQSSLAILPATEFYQQRHLVAKQGNTAKEIINFAYEISLSYSYSNEKHANH